MDIHPAARDPAAGPTAVNPTEPKAGTTTAFAATVPVVTTAMSRPFFSTLVSAGAAIQLTAAPVLQCSSFAFLCRPTRSIGHLTPLPHGCELVEQDEAKSEVLTRM